MLQPRLIRAARSTVIVLLPKPGSPSMTVTALRAIRFSHTQVTSSGWTSASRETTALRVLLALVVCFGCCAATALPLSLSNSSRLFFSSLFASARLLLQLKRHPLLPPWQSGQSQSRIRVSVGREQRGG